MRDQPPADAQPEQLRPSEHTVLPSGKLADQRVNGNRSSFDSYFVFNGE
jgi:hypothetical protein